MCHLLLLLPLAALPVLWLMPAPVAIPIYAIAVVVAGWAYVYAVKALRLPLASAEARLEQTVGRVSAVRSGGRCRVEMLGESWQGASADPVHDGDRVRVTGRDGLTLHVRKV